MLITWNIWNTSMTYMTAGIIDSFEIPDVGCETALTKIYCTETLKTCVNSCLQVLAMAGYSSLSEFETSYLTDLNYLSVMFNTNDYLRLYVATSGTILAGMEFGDDLVKLRNPFTNPGYAMKKILANKILKQCIISSWRISRAFSATVYSHLLVCKKQVTAALFSKLRINKMKSPVNMLKIQISGNFQRPALAFQTKTRMKNVRK